MEIRRVGDVKWEIIDDKLKVPAYFFANENILKKIKEDESLQQLRNLGTLPGVVGFVVAMPDIHQGYGAPVGGIAAFDSEDGIVSPGTVGYDINCGVRLYITDLKFQDIKSRIERIVDEIFKEVPAGVGLSGHLKLGKKEMERIEKEGAQCAVEMGFGDAEELQSIESYGKMDGADPSAVSEKAYERGRDQLGTVGSGNHFVEVGYVDKIFDRETASEWGIKEEGIVTILIHSGSRGFGHQVCDDYLKECGRWIQEKKISLPDRQLVFAHISSSVAKRYISAMNAAINFAFANRMIIGHFVKKAMRKVIGDINFRLIYDVAHNTAKFEKHIVNGKERTLIVHRKGATRAFPAGHPDLPKKYASTGQPVIIPGDMGRYSFLLKGLEGSMMESFGSTCHGAGRVLSRSKAIKIARSERRDIKGELLSRGIVVKAREQELLAEEMPDAYKDVSDVVEVCEKAGLSKIVARMRPMGVVKG